MSEQIDYEKFRLKVRKPRKEIAIINEQIDKLQREKLSRNDISDIEDIYVTVQKMCSDYHNEKGKK